MNMELNEAWELVQKIIEFPLFTVKQTPVTLLSIVILFFFLGLVGLFARLVRKLMTRWLSRLSYLEEGTRFVLIRVTQYIIFAIGIITAFQFIGLDLSGLTVIFGLLSVGIGFGLQNIVSNFISGLVLLFERPIRVGDRVIVGEHEGDVEEINIRSTTIRTLQNISVIVPNSEFTSQNVINWSHGDRRVRLPINVGVSYGSDLDAVNQALLDVAAENPKIMKVPKPEVHHTNFGNSSWDMRLWAWIKNPKEHAQIRSELHGAIIKKFRENNIEIPFPQRDLHLRSAEPLVIKQ